MVWTKLRPPVMFVFITVKIRGYRGETEDLDTSPFPLDVDRQTGHRTKSHEIGKTKSRNNDF